MTEKERIKEDLIRRFEMSKQMNVRLIDMDPVSLAGFYVSKYPDPMTALTIDISSGKIASSVGNSAKTILRTCV